MSHSNETSTKNDHNNFNNRLDETQQLINAALDSALDALDSDHDDNNDEENDDETFSDCISHENEIHTLHQIPNDESPQPLPPTKRNHQNPNTNYKNTTRPIQGPPKPPVTASDDSNNDMDHLFTSMMEQLMNMSQADDDGGGAAAAKAATTTTTTTSTTTNMDPLLADVMSNINDDEELLGRFMQEIQTRLQSEFFPAVTTTSATTTTTTTNNNNAAKNAVSPSSPPPTTMRNVHDTPQYPNDYHYHHHKATSTKSKETTTPLSQPPTESNVNNSNNNNNNNNSEVESVISNLVSNLSQTMNRHMNDDIDDEDDDISELDDDLPDMDDMMNHNNNDTDDNMAVLLQKLMGNLMHPTNTGADTFSNPNDHADTILDGMMEQLLCKDIMYEPMKQVASKFPQWLQQHQSVLSATEYERRCQQNASFQKIVQIYETEPIDMKQLMVWMQDVQEYGPPPSDIIQAIAPGMALDDNGIPIMNPTTSTSTGSDKNAFPPFGANNNNDEDCRIM